MGNLPTSVEISPCPFCEKSKVEVINPRNSNNCFVYCWECGAQGPKFGALAHGFEWATEQAIIAWNLRPIEIRLRREQLSEKTGDLVRPVWVDKEPK